MNTFYKKFIELSSIIILLTVPYFLVLQGIDFTDKGLMLSYSMQMFAYPYAYHSYSAVWLSGVIGHVWLALFPVKGMLGLNIFFVLLLQVNALTFFLILKKYYPSFILLPAICIAILLSIPMIQNGFGYQCLTVVTLNLAALLLFKGATEIKNKIIFVSALLLSVSIFIRLPNILGFVFFFLLIGHHTFIERKINNALWKKIAWFLSGFISGFILIALLIQLCGYAAYFKAGIHEIQFRTQSSGNAYNETSLLAAYSADAIKGAAISLKYLFLISLLVYVVSFFQIAFWRNIVVKKLHWGFPLLAVAAILYMSGHYDINYIMKYHIKYILSGVSIIIGFLMLFIQEQYKKEKVFLFISAIIIYAVSFAGSNTGMNPYGLMFLILFVLVEMLSFVFFEPNKSIFINQLSKNLSLLIVIILVPLSFLINYKFVYRDDNNRSELKYSIHSPLLNGLYTSKQRADVVNGLLDVIATKVHQGDETWATPNLPMIYALTATKPYLDHPWENLLLPDEIQTMIARAETSEPKLPLIIRAKGSTRNNYWPEKIIPDDDKYFIQKTNILNQFIARHNYTITWQNNFFEIWQAK